MIRKKDRSEIFMKNKMSYIMALTLSVALILVFAGCANEDGSTGPAETATAEPAEEPVSFNAVTLGGESVDESIFSEHKVNFVHYWATWCGPCMSELPEFPELAKEYEGKVGFFGIVDDATDESSTAHAAQVLEDAGIEFMNLQPFKEVPSIFGLISGVPCTMIVDENGNPLTRQILGAVGMDAYRGYLDKALENAQ